MSATVIEVDQVSKKFRLGQDASYSRLSETLQNCLFPQKRRATANGADINEFWALRDVSFTVEQGQAVGIIGRNGAGKSTLLKILSRITRPTSGHIRTRGRIGSLLEVGTGFHPELTGRENIFLNGSILGMSRREIERKFDEIVAFAEIDTFLDTPVKRYSSGMYTRLAFSVAAHLEPEILIVDEVLAVGDAQFQKKCLGKMRDVTLHGRTVLFVSHNMASLKSLCTHALYLKSGQKIAFGDIEPVVEQYATEMNSPETFTFSDNPDKCPGSNYLKILAMNIQPVHEKRLSIASGIEFIFDVLILEQTPEIEFAIRIENNEHVVILDQGVKLSPQQFATSGPITIKAAMPPDQLHAGVYSVSIVLTNIKEPGYVMLQSMAVFEIPQSNPLTYSYQIPGIVPTSLVWSTQA